MGRHLRRIRNNSTVHVRRDVPRRGGGGEHKNPKSRRRVPSRTFAPSADGSSLTSFFPSQHTNDMYNKYTPLTRYLVSIYTSLRRLTLSHSLSLFRRRVRCIIPHRAPTPRAACRRLICQETPKRTAAAAARKTNSHLVRALPHLKNRVSRPVTFQVCVLVYIVYLYTVALSATPYFRRCRRSPRYDGDFVPPSQSFFLFIKLLAVYRHLGRRRSDFPRRREEHGGAFLLF